MRKNIFLIIGILFLNVSFGQEIDMKLNPLGYKFVQNGEKLNWKKLEKATKPNYEANLLIKKAKKHNTVSKISALFGGVLIGVPIGQSINDRNPDWILAYIGTGIAIAGIPFSFSAFNKVNEGVDKYNLSLKPTSYKFNPELKIFTNGNGIGLLMNF